MVDLVFHQAGADARVVGENACLGQVGTDSHFLQKTALRRGGGLLAWPGVSAARVRPQSAAVILPVGPAVQENPAVVIAYENGESAMKQAVPVSVELRRAADDLVALIHEDY